jgi:ribose transport system permease protein
MTSSAPTIDRPPAPVRPAERVQGVLRRNLYLFALLLSIAMLIVNITMQPNFGPIRQLAGFAPLALAAIATTCAVLVGGVDLSISAQMTLSSVVFIGYLTPAGLGGIVAVPILLLLGAAVGAINGILVVVLRLQPIVATLASMFVITGVNLRLAPAPLILHESWVLDLAGSMWIIPGGVISIGVGLLIWYVFRRTAFGANVYAVGGNDATAYSAGIRVGAVRLLAYALGGVIAAVGGLALTALVSSIDASASMAYTLPAIAAVALGGVAITGGRGGMLGAVCGAAAIFLAQNMLSVFSVPSIWINLVFGLLLLFAVTMGAVMSAPRKRVI